MHFFVVHRKDFIKQWLVGTVFSAVCFYVLGMAIALMLKQIENMDGFSSSYAGELGGGTLIIAGGGELPPEIPNLFCQLAGGTRARIVVIPSYDATPNEERDLIREWKNRRAATVDVAKTRTRGDKASIDLASKIRQATGVWITGGRQSVTAEYYSGSEIEEELHNLLERGGVIGGTSAGAAVMSRVMITEGRKEAKITQGLDLFRGAVVDQHFMHRNRLTRLRGVLDQHPHAIGVGIDEGTALVVKVKSGYLHVVGNSYVMLWAPSGTSAPHHAEFLKSGDTFDLDEFDWQNESAEYRADS